MWTWRRSPASPAAVRRGLFAAVAAAVLAACATVPAARRMPLEPARFGLFPAAEAYFAFRLTAPTRAAAERLLPESAGPFLRRAERIYGAAAPDGLYAAAEGRFSPGAVGRALAFSGGWKRLSGDRWRSADGLHEAATPGPGLLLLGSGDLAPLIGRVGAAPGFAMPPEAAAALAAADFYGYIPSVPAAMAGGLPIRSAWASFAPDEDGRFRGSLTLLLAGSNGGRLTSLAVRALLTRLLREAQVADYAARLRDVTVQADGDAIRASGLVLTAEEIAAVVQAFGGRT